MLSKNNRFVLPLLHIDDNSDDRSLIQEAILATNTPFTFHGVEGVQAAVDYFLESAIERSFSSHLDRLPDHPRPALILLDYDLDSRCGHRFPLLAAHPPPQHRHSRRPL